MASPDSFGLSGRIYQLDVVQTMVVIHSMWQLPGRTSFPDLVNDLHMPLQLITEVQVVDITDGSAPTHLRNFTRTINFHLVMPQLRTHVSYARLVSLGMSLDLTSSVMTCPIPLGRPLTINVGLSMYTGSYGAYKASTRAMVDINAAGILPFGSTLQNSGGYDPATASGGTFTSLTGVTNWQVRTGLPPGTTNALSKSASAIAMIGDPAGFTQMGLLSTYFQRPNLQCLSGSYVLQGDQDSYEYTVQSITPDRTDALAMLNIMRRHNWNKVGVVSTQDQNGQSWALAMQSVLSEDMIANFFYIQVVTSASVPDAAQNRQIDLTLNLIKASGYRIFIMKSATAIAPYIIMRAWDLGLIQPPYQWFVVSVCQGNYASTFINAGYSDALKAVPCLFSSFSQTPTIAYTNAGYNSAFAQPLDIQSVACYESMWLLAYAIRDLMLNQSTSASGNSNGRIADNIFNLNGGRQLLDAVYSVNETGPWSGLPLRPTPKKNIASVVPVLAWSTDLDGSNGRFLTVAQYNEATDFMSYSYELIFSGGSLVAPVDRDIPLVDGTMIEPKESSTYIAVSAVIGLVTVWSTIQFLLSAVQCRRQTTFHVKLGQSTAVAYWRYYQHYGSRLLFWVAAAGLTFGLGALWSMDVLQTTSADYSPCTPRSDTGLAITHIIVLNILVSVVFFIALLSVETNSLNKYHQDISDRSQTSSSDSASSSFQRAKQRLQQTMKLNAVLFHLWTVYAMSSWPISIASLLMSVAVVGSTHFAHLAMRLCANNTFTSPVGTVVTLIFSVVVVQYTMVVLFRGYRLRKVVSLRGYRSLVLSAVITGFLLLVQYVNRLPYDYTFNLFYLNHPTSYLTYDHESQSNVWVDSPWASPSDWDQTIIQVVVASFFAVSLFICVALLIERNKLSKNIMDVKLLQAQNNLNGVKHDAQVLIEKQNIMYKKRIAVRQAVQFSTHARPLHTNVGLAMAYVPPSSAEGLATESKFDGSSRRASLPTDISAAGSSIKTTGAIELLLMALEPPLRSLQSSLSSASFENHPSFTLDRVLRHPVTFELMRDFVSPGHSYSLKPSSELSKLFTFWLDLERLCQLVDSSVRHVVAKEMAAQFLAVGSPHHIVNVLSPKARQLLSPYDWNSVTATITPAEEAEMFWPVSANTKTFLQFWLQLQIEVYETINQTIWPHFKQQPSCVKLSIYVLNPQLLIQVGESAHGASLQDANEVTKSHQFTSNIPHREDTDHFNGEQHSAE